MGLWRWMKKCKNKHNSYHSGPEQSQEQNCESCRHAGQTRVDQKVGPIPGPGHVDVVGVVEEPDGPEQADHHQAQVEGNKVTSTE